MFPLYGGDSFRHKKVPPKLLQSSSNDRFEGTKCIIGSVVCPFSHLLSFLIKPVYSFKEHVGSSMRKRTGNRTLASLFFGSSGTEM